MRNLKFYFISLAFFTLIVKVQAQTTICENSNYKFSIIKHLDMHFSLLVEGSGTSYVFAESFLSSDKDESCFCSDSSFVLLTKSDYFGSSIMYKFQLKDNRWIPLETIPLKPLGLAEGFIKTGKVYNSVEDYTLVSMDEVLAVEVEHIWRKRDPKEYKIVDGIPSGFGREHLVKKYEVLYKIDQNDGTLIQQSKKEIIDEK